MKTIVILLLLSFSAYSQSYTEKWNSLSSRYEFFDSNGNMIAYKAYNSLSRQWETYNVKTQSNYQPESSINQPLLERVLTSKQAKYDNNSQRVSNFITDTRELLNSSSLDRGLVQRIKDRFNNEYLRIYYNESVDLSSKAATDGIIYWLSSGFDKILKEETDKFLKTKSTTGYKF